MDRFKRLTFFILFMIPLLACRFFSSSPDDPFEVLTPDLTSTAFFETLQSPSLTPPPVFTATTELLVSDTPLASDTQPPPVVTSTMAPPEPGTLLREDVIVRCHFIAVPPTIDGDLTEWVAVPYSIDAVVFGQNHWSGETDLESTVMVAWDDDYLYLASRIFDDQYVQNSSGENLYKGDSVEILLDANLQTDFYVSQLSPDDFQLGISAGKALGDEFSETYLWYPEAISGVRNQVKAASSVMDKGFILEMAIPWAIFEVMPQSGKYYGFAFSVSDNDLIGGNQQQSMVSLVTTRSFLNPTTWGNLFLEK